MLSWLKSLIQQSSAITTLAVVIPLGTLLHEPAPKEIVYKHTTQGDLRLFCFAPSDTKFAKPFPVTLWIHGGGWTGGTYESFFPMARYTALRGSFGCVIEYRLVQPGKTTLADCIGDCKSAVRYLREHAGELCIDPHRIAVLGESAGGHLAAAVGTLDGMDDPTDDKSISARPDAMVLYDPPTQLKESDIDRLYGASVEVGKKSSLLQELSPLQHVRPGQPPAICVHGLEDVSVSPDCSRQFASAMQQSGNRCDLVLLPETPHAFLIPNYKCSEEVVVNAFKIADKFLASLGYFSGESPLVVSNPPSWQPKWSPHAKLTKP